VEVAGGIWIAGLVTIVLDIVPGITDTVLSFAAYLSGVVFLLWLSQRIIFWAEYRHCKRRATCLSIEAYICKTTGKRSGTDLVMAFVISTLAAIGGTVALLVGEGR